MTDQSAGAGGPRWLREPPPGSAAINVAVGADAAITPELREALEALTRTFQHDEVERYRARNCPDYLVCVPLGGCNPYIAAPCATFTTCRIDP